MKTVASLQDLHRLAAETGAIAHVGGKVVNASGARTPVGAKRIEAPVVEPMPPAPLPTTPTVSIDEVRRLLDERDVAWEKRIDVMFSALLAAEKKDESPPAWKFSCSYGEEGELLDIIAVPSIN